MNKKNIPNDLKNKTGLNETYENELIQRIDEIEKQGSVVAPLTQVDWIITAVLFLFVGIAPVIYYADILSR
jgi:hypothetical protein